MVGAGPLGVLPGHALEVLIGSVVPGPNYLRTNIAIGLELLTFARNTWCTRGQFPRWHLFRDGKLLAY